jgi:hypothetical protein
VGVGHAQAGELDRDGCGEIASGLECVDRLEWVRAVAVVFGGARRHLRGELLGNRDKTSTGIGSSCKFDRHGKNLQSTPQAIRGRSIGPGRETAGEPQSVAASRATGTPLVTMS